MADEAELFAIVVANPFEDAPREVLADHWLERGDPRGELVTLQLRFMRGKDTGDDFHRMIQLYDEDAWIGDLGAVTVKRRYDRGFLDRIQLAKDDAASPAIWDAAARSVWLGTLRTLWRGEASESRIRSFLYSPACVVLEEAQITPAMLDEVLENKPKSLRRIELEMTESIRPAVERAIASGVFDGVALFAADDWSLSDCCRLFELTTERTNVIIRTALDQCTARRTRDGLEIAAATGDTDLAAAAYNAFPESKFRLLPPGPSREVSPSAPDLDPDPHD